MPLHFTQSCPTCGRRLQVHTRLLGQQVACQHCRAEFYAGASEEGISSDSNRDLLARAEAMLKVTPSTGPQADQVPLAR